MTGVAPTDPARPQITTLDDLRKHLHEACIVEMSTIPLYLYAMYSIESQIQGGPAGYIGDINKSSSASAIPTMSPFRTFRSVVVEEMLHLTLARNVLYSIGGEIDFYDPDFVPKYGIVDGQQQFMLHRLPLLAFNLDPCSKELIKDTFMALELPAAADDPPQSDWYNTIGQFYRAIEQGFVNVQNSIGASELFANDQAAYQLHSVASYWNQEGGGAPIPVVDLDSARAAMNEIIVQGEGAADGLSPVTFPDPDYVRSYEFGHYQRFERIYEGIDQLGRIIPLATNPRLEQFSSNPELHGLVELANAIYCYTLLLIDEIYRSPLPNKVVAHALDSAANPISEKGWDKIQQKPKMKRKWGLTQALLTTMQGLLFPVIDLIIREDMPGQPGTKAGPTFEYYEFQAGDVSSQLLSLCDRVAGTWPSLGGVDSVRTRIADLPAIEYRPGGAGGATAAAADE